MESIKKTILRSSVLSLAFLPVITFAQPDDGSRGSQNFSEFERFIGGVTTFINNTLIPLIFGLALLVFIWGMFRFFIYGGHNEEEKEKGKSLMVWATVGFVLMVSIWGIVNLIAGGLGFGGESINQIPTIPTR